MKRMACLKPATRLRERGFSMIEVLVTLLVISLALLGTVGLQAYSMRLNQGGQLRTQAVILVADMAERMEANQLGVVGGAYLLAADDTQNCIANACNATSLAAFDLAQWQAAAANALPQATTLIERSSAAPLIYTIRVGWVDRLSDVNYAAVNESSGVGANTAGTGERFFYTATRRFAN